MKLISRALVAMFSSVVHAQKKNPKKESMLEVVCSADHLKNK